MKRTGKHQTRSGQGRGRGICRNSTDEIPSTTGRQKRNMENFCRRFSDSLFQTDKPQAEAVVGDEKRSYTSTPKSQKEQVGRLTQALKNIEAKIKSFEEGK